MLRAHHEILATRTLTWPDEASCADAAAALALALQRTPELRDAFIALSGPLGAGKTTFVRHLLRALGVAGRIKSPTYAVLEPHEVVVDDQRLAISHLDFYRFADPREWVDAGLRDLFAAPGLKLAEWPEQAAAVLPVPDLALGIEPALTAALTAASTPADTAADTTADTPPRRVLAEAATPRGVALLQALPR